MKSNLAVQSELLRHKLVAVRISIDPHFSFHGFFKKFYCISHYVLTEVVCHHGESPCSGHYTVLTRQCESRLQESGTFIVAVLGDHPADVIRWTIPE